MQVEILKELKTFTIPERLAIVEAALRLIREDLQQVGKPITRTERKRQLDAAAEALLQDYAAGSELTIFTALDRGNFLARRCKRSLKHWQLCCVPSYNRISSL